MATQQVQGMLKPHLTKEWHLFTQKINQAKTTRQGFHPNFGVVDALKGHFDMYAEITGSAVDRDGWKTAVEDAVVCWSLRNPNNEERQLWSNHIIRELKTLLAQVSA